MNQARKCQGSWRPPQTLQGLSWPPPLRHTWAGIRAPGVQMAARVKLEAFRAVACRELARWAAGFTVGGFQK